MSISKSLSILFYIKKEKLNQANQAPIYLRITIDKKKAELSLKQYIDPVKWDVSKGYARGTSRAIREVNQTLDSVRNQIYEAQNELIRANELVTAAAIKNILTGEKDKQYSLLEIAKYHNERMKAQVGTKFAIGTYKNYKTTYKCLKEFIPMFYEIPDIYLSQIKYRFITDYEHYLITTRGCSNNGAVKHIQRLKKLVNMAVNHGWLERNPFSRYRITLEKVNRGYLTVEELKAIESIELPTRKLDSVRDLFVFSCYTGLAYIDVKQLTPTNIITGIDGKLWINHKRQKTKVKLSIPLLPKANEILDKYIDDEECLEKGTLLPVKSHQKVNDYLKDIAELCGIKKRLTFHLARHTFATTVTLSNGVPIETVSKMLGHTSLKTTQIYSRVLDTKISRDMEMLREKLE